MCAHDRVTVLDRCLRRVRRWLPPPKWSRKQWHDEARAIGELAMCEAERDHDPASGIDHDAFLYQRIMAAILAAYRKEWRYGRRCGTALERIRTAEDGKEAGDGLLDLLNFLAVLDGESQQILAHYYLLERTEDEIATTRGVSQKTVSRHIRSALAELRWHWMEMGIHAPPAEARSRSGGRRTSSAT